MLKLRYYSKGKGNEEILVLLAHIKQKNGIAHEVFDLSKHEKYNEKREKEVYERDFKPRARLLKRRTGKSITELKSKSGHYYVSLPGTIAVLSDGQVEWFTLGENEIIGFLQSVLERGISYLEECCQGN